MIFATIIWHLNVTVLESLCVGSLTEGAISTHVDKNCWSNRFYRAYLSVISALCLSFYFYFFPLSTQRLNVISSHAQVAGSWVYETRVSGLQFLASLRLKFHLSALGIPCNRINIMSP